LADDCGKAGRPPQRQLKRLFDLVFGLFFALLGDDPEGAVL